MNKIFEIGAWNESAEDSWLLLELGTDFCTASQYDANTSSIHHLVYYRQKLIDDAKAFETWLSNLPSASAKLVCSVALPTSILVPFAFEQDSENAVRTIYNEAGHEYRTDRISEWQMINAWSLPKSWLQKLLQKNSEAEIVHAYTPSLKVYNGFSVVDQIAIHFTPQEFRVLVKKDGAVQLAQMYSYATPLDVVYYLLKIVAAYEFAQSQVYLILSGLIEEDSALFKELQNYFIQIHFARPQFSLPENNLPAHYFTSVYNLAACVS